MGDWVFPGVLGAGIIHILEEYVYPGGFADALRNLLPRAAHLFTPRFHVVVNGLLLLLCLGSALIGKDNFIFSLSVFGLVFANAVLHIRGAILTKRYYPGVISSILIYIPLAIYAYARFLVSEEITWLEGAFSFLLGTLYMVALMCYVLLSRARGRAN